MALADNNNGTSRFINAYVYLELYRKKKCNTENQGVRFREGILLYVLIFG